jgi:hypothetical protein
MRKISAIMLVLCMLFVRNATAQQTTEKGPRIEFKKLEHDYGTILKGANGTCTFEFRNTGDAPLIIAYAKTSCGCLAPEWPKEPIAPGAKGKITLRYDTQRVGPINTSATVTSNAVNSPTQVIRIKGTVKPLPEPETPVNNTGEPNNN